MPHHRARSLRLLVPVLAASLAAIAGAAQPRGGDLAPSADTSALYRRDTGIDSSGNYRQELQACRSGRTQQARDTCIEEARHAHAALRRGALVHAGENYTANALARCVPLAGEDRFACEARVLGFGTTTGSVAGGGLLREVQTVLLPASP